MSVADNDMRERLGMRPRVAAPASNGSPSDVVERVAKALAIEYYKHDYSKDAAAFHFESAEEFSEQNWKDFETDAKAAIAAMGASMVAAAPESVDSDSRGSEPNTKNKAPAEAPTKILTEEEIAHCAVIMRYADSPELAHELYYGKKDVDASKNHTDLNTSGECAQDLNTSETTDDLPLILRGRPASEKDVEWIREYRKYHGAERTSLHDAVKACVAAFDKPAESGTSDKEKALARLTRDILRSLKDQHVPADIEISCADIAGKVFDGLVAGGYLAGTKP